MGGTALWAAWNKKHYETKRIGSNMVHEEFKVNYPLLCFSGAPCKHCHLPLAPANKRPRAGLPA